MPCVLQGRWDVWQQDGSDASSHLRISFPGWLFKTLVTLVVGETHSLPQRVYSAGKPSQMRVTAKVQEKQRMEMKEGEIV